MRKRREPRRTYLARNIVSTFPSDTPYSSIALALGVEHSTVSYWCAKDAWINAYLADRYACKLGMHPSEIWTDWFSITEDCLV